LPSRESFPYFSETPTRTPNLAGAMDTAMDVDLVQSNKICRTCRRNTIPGHLPFKNCSICRGKNRVKEARRVERRREEDKYMEVHKKMLMESVLMEGDDGPRFPTKENAISSGSKSSTISFPETMKANIQPRSLYELEGKEKKHAIKEIKASLQKRIQDNGGIVAQVTRSRVVSFLSTLFELWTYYNNSQKMPESFKPLPCYTRS